MRYLERRNLLPPPPDLRFHPRCPYLPRPKTAFLPALLVTVREGRTLVAIQHVFLDPTSADYTRKVILGTPLFGAWRGREGGTTLAIAEGFETADAFTRLDGTPCWASLGTRRLVIPPAITTLLIAENNDLEGRRAAIKAADHYTRSGLNVRRAPLPARFKYWARSFAAGSLAADIR